MDERIQKYEEKMKKTLASLESELVTIRAGRANPHILDKLAVDYYGAPTVVNSCQAGMIMKKISGKNENSYIEN